ncbi:MAG: DUF167 domain-containing protein [Candidatus Thorarchaeota archaeon]
MTDSAIWETEDGTYLRVIVKPRSKERAFVSEISDEFIVLNLRSPAREGKANSELQKTLAKALGVSTGDIRIIAGHKNREKTIVIEGISKDKIIERLAQLGNDK